MDLTTQHRTRPPIFRHFVQPDDRNSIQSIRQRQSYRRRQVSMVPTMHKLSIKRMCIMNKCFLIFRCTHRAHSPINNNGIIFFCGFAGIQFPFNLYKLISLFKQIVLGKMRCNPLFTYIRLYVPA